MNGLFSVALLLAVACVAAQPTIRDLYKRRNSKSSLVIHVPMRMPSYDDVKKGFVIPPVAQMPMVVQWVNNKPVTLATTEKPLATTVEAGDLPAIFDMSLMNKPSIVDSEAVEQTVSSSNDAGLNEVAVTVDNVPFFDETATVDAEFMPVKTPQEAASAVAVGLPLADEVEGSGAPLPTNVRSKRDTKENEIEHSNPKDKVPHELSEASKDDSEARQYGRNPHRIPVGNQYHGQHPGMMSRMGNVCYGFYCQVKSFVKYLLL